MNVSRRSFLLGGTASILGAGALLSSCNHRVKTSVGDSSNVIAAMVEEAFDSFDYTGTANPTIASIGWHIFEALYEIDRRTNEVYPALAKDHPKKIDNLTYEIELREDAKFSNNARVMSGDVVNALRKAKNSPSVGFLFNFLKECLTDGSDKVKLRLNYSVKGVMESRLTLAKIYPAAASDVDMQTKPIGSGPYQITEMNGTEGGQILFAPNSYYNGKIEKPNCKMSWNINFNEQSRVSMLKGKSVQVSEAIPIESVNELREAGINVDFEEGFQNALVSFNTVKEPMNKKEIRHALFYAIDTKKLIDEYLEGHAYEASCYLSRKNKNYHKCNYIYEYDVEKAKDLLKKNNVTNPEITFVFDTNCWAYDFKDTIIENLEAVGFKVNAIEDFFRWTDIEPKLAKYNFDVFLSTLDRSIHGENADYLLNNMFYQSSKMENQTKYSQSENNRLDEIKNLIDLAADSVGEQQQEYYNKCFDIIADEMPVYPLMHRESVTGFDGSKLKGFKAVSTGGLYLLGCSIQS